MYLWVDSELKDVYKINEEQTWAEQKEDIVTKLLPPLYKLVNKKYNITNTKLLKMLYGRWRSRHRVNNIKKQGEERVKLNKRRAKKNSKMQLVSKYSINMNGNLVNFIDFIDFTIALLEEKKKSAGNELSNRE